MTSVRMLFAAALAAAIVAVAAAAPAAQAGQLKQMVRTINYVRSWSNRHKLAFSSRLSRGAAAWARSLMQRSVLQHDGNAVSHGEGEIIEWHTGARALINRTVIEWFHSTGHRRVMMAGDFRRAGAGRATGYYDGRKCTIWVVRFAR